MKALLFFGIVFGFLFLLMCIVAIPTYINERKRTNEMRDNFINRFS